MMRNGSSRINRTLAESRATICGPLAEELERWVTRTPLPRHDDRWSTWAQRVAGRHRLLGGRWTSSAMDFLELDKKSTIVNRVIRQRWISSIALFPRLQLTLRNILGGVFSFSQTQTTLTTSDDLGSEAVPKLPARRGDPVSHGARPRFEYAMATSRNDRSGGEGENRYDEARFGFRDGRLLAALNRAFRRLEADDDLSLAWRRIAFTPETTAATAKRIVASGSRTEERTARGWNPSPALVHKQTAVSPEAQKIGPDSFAEPLPPIAPKASKIDVDELTSHVIREIDKRTTAWRERMGRV